MTTMLLLLLSGVLIGTGVSLIWRDLHNKRRDAFVLSRDPKADPEAEPDVEITVSRPAASAPLMQPAPAETAAPRRTLSSQLLKIAKRHRVRCRRTEIQRGTDAAPRCSTPIGDGASSGRCCSP